MQTARGRHHLCSPGDGCRPGLSLAHRATFVNGLRCLCEMNPPATARIKSVTERNTGEGDEGPRPPVAVSLVTVVIYRVIYMN